MLRKVLTAGDNPGLAERGKDAWLEICRTRDSGKRADATADLALREGGFSSQCREDSIVIISTRAGSGPFDDLGPPAL